MKKFLLIIFLFFCCINVNALERKFAGSEYLDGIAYMKYDGNTHYYRNAQVIRDTSTGAIAYCVEPFSLLVDNSSYTSFDAYSSNFGFGINEWNIAKLYAYYGYGYKNHTDKKWISITQMAIWRIMYPKYQFEWIDNVTSRKIITPYEEELKELKKLVNAHYSVPSFNSTYSVKINDVLELEDTRNVLQNFVIASSDFDISVEGNKLIINSGEEIKKGKIVLRRDHTNYDNSVIYFYSSSSQNVIERGNVESFSIQLIIKTYSGGVNITKVDSESNDVSQGEAELDGTVFDLYDSEMNYLKSVETVNHEASFTDLTYGKYYVKESTPGKGYYLNDKTYEFEINEENPTASLVIENNVIKSKIKIIKYYGSRNDFNNNKMMKEKNVSFNIYDKDDNLVCSGITNEDGIIECTLPYGKYVIRQIDTTLGYQKNDDYWFSINEESSYSIEIPLYDFKIEVFNAGIDIFNFIMHLLCLR